MYDRLSGVLPEPVDEGTHLRVPWFQTPHVMDIRTRPRTISSVTGTNGACACGARAWCARAHVADGERQGASN